MQLQDFYPIIVTEHLPACRDFYRRWFEFEVAFEATWFVLLGTTAGRRATLAFMHPSHPSAPPGPEAFAGTGMCLEFQVADAAAEYARFHDGGAPIMLALRDEPFGQRRFGSSTPRCLDRCSGTDRAGAGLVGPLPASRHRPVVRLQEAGYNICRPGTRVPPCWSNLSQFSPSVSQTGPSGTRSAP